MCDDNTSDDRLGIGSRVMAGIGTIGLGSMSYDLFAGHEITRFEEYLVGGAVACLALMLACEAISGRRATLGD